MTDPSLDALLRTAVRNQSPDEPTFDIVTIDAGDFDALVAAARAQSETDGWAAPEVSEDGDVVEVTAFSADRKSLITISVYPDKVIKVIASGAGTERQTLLRAQSRP